MANVNKRIIKTVKSLAPWSTSNVIAYIWIEGQVNTLYPKQPLVDLPLKDMRLYHSESCHAEAVFTDTRNGKVTYGYPAANASNVSPAYECSRRGWDSRLYSGAYSKFVSAARQGSSEWGMNIVQGRKALNTIVQLSLTSATTVAAFVQANRAAIGWLNSNPKVTPRRVKRMRLQTDRDLRRARTKEERRRLSNLTWLLGQVSGTLLAYRYGVAPLMSDLYTTAQTLSEPFDDKVSLRKSSQIAWNGPKTEPGVSAWTGKESVVLKATVSVNNPNLLLANRLGLTNPQYWVWDATPWSFMIDWWLPIGSFLGNFTALVGLSLDSASVTRSRSYSAKWLPDETYDAYRALYPYMKVVVTPRGSGDLYGKRKNRTTGSLPIPLSVPYGTGLGIQRGQNALALAAQLLKGKFQ